MGDVIGLRRVVRSMTENVSSPTLFMRLVIMAVNDVPVAGAMCGVAATVDAPLMPGRSRAAIAKTETCLRSCMVFLFADFTWL